MLSFSDAAKALNIAQSSLSQQIKQLEDELDVKLFLRNSHSIALTEAGKVMLPFALRTIHDAQTCTDRIRDLQKLLTGSLCIGVTYSFSPILTETVISFMKLYPHIKLNIIYEPMNKLMELLAKRQLDFVLAFKPTLPMSNRTHCSRIDCRQWSAPHTHLHLKRKSHCRNLKNMIWLCLLRGFRLEMPSTALSTVRIISISASN